MLVIYSTAQSIQSAMLSLQSSEWAPLVPNTRKLVLLPPPLLGSGGGGLTRLLERGMGGANSDEGTDTLV